MNGDEKEFRALRNMHVGMDLVSDLLKVAHADFMQVEKEAIRCKTGYLTIAAT